MEILKISMLVLAGYLIGNISFARIISEKKGKSITKLGSGNPGTMNMLRNFGMKTGTVTLLLDILKGVIGGLIGFLGVKFLGVNLPAESMIYACGLAVVVGHIFPVFHKFKGGKGIASGVGVFLMANPIYTLVIFAIGILIIYLTKLGSIGSLFVITTLAVIECIRLFDVSIVAFVCIILIAILVWYSHKNNVVRLVKGEENEVHIFGKPKPKEEILEEKPNDVEIKAESKEEDKK